MTPMVDLGFLLIAFFVMTTELSKPSVVKLNMPKQGPETPVANSNALTVLLGNNNQIYYYEGNWEQALAGNNIFRTQLSVYDGFGNIIREKQKSLDTYNKKDRRDGLILLIKAGKNASYENVISALDEAMINLVKRYAVLSAEKEEERWLDLQVK